MSKQRFEAIDSETGEVWFSGVSATRQDPCPVCGKPTSQRMGYCVIDHARGRVWCGHSRDAYRGAYFDIDKKSWGPPPKTVQTVREECTIDWDSLQAELSAGLSKMDAFRHGTSLHVSAESLVTLGAGWSQDFGALTFPMRDAAGTIVGMRIRKPDGFKFAIRGSRNCLFISPASREEPTVFICEGPTDTAAGLDLGLPVVGRASALTCRRELTEFCSGRKVVIIRDPDKDGVKGAEDLARDLDSVCSDVRVIVPIGARDLRIWKRNGATKSLILATAANCRKWGRH